MVLGEVHVGAGAILLFDSAEISGSRGPVRIGSRVQILENTVLHLLPGNELIVDDDAVTGPGAMIHAAVSAAAVSSSRARSSATTAWSGLQVHCGLAPAV